MGIKEPLQMTLVASRPQVAAVQQAQVLYVLVTVGPAERVAQTRPTLNLSLVIDRSTSMYGERLNRVKMATSLLLEKLAPEDVVSVVSFSDRAEVLVAARRAADRTHLISQINQMVASGGTEIFQGLAAGVKELRKLASTSYVNHLILLTDGHTYGDADACLELARACGGEGIGFSAFGIGTEWNDVFLDALVAPSGGRTAYISSPQHILRQLQARIQGLGEVYAHNVRLRIDLPKGVSLREGFKVSPYAQPVPVRKGEIALGAIEGKAPLICLLEVNVQPQTAGESLYFPVQLLASMPDRADKTVSLLEDLTISVVAHAGRYTPSRRIVEAVRALNFYRMNEDAIHAVANGQVGVATERMRHLTQRLRDAGHTVLAEKAEQETQRLAQQGQMSADGQKQLRYGTRALVARDAVDG